MPRSILSQSDVGPGPVRIIYNFATKCNMGCRFCYIPFEPSELVDRARAHAVLQVLRTWPEVQSITFGGGDPLIYPFFLDLIADVRSNWRSDVFIQVDTNGLALSKRRLRTLAPMIDLLGLPLDAVSDGVNLRMRESPTQWRRIPELVPAARNHGLRVKINTVVGRPNLHEIPAIGELASEVGANIWSLYEFWPIGELALRSRDNFAVPRSTYEQVLARLVESGTGPEIEAGSQSDRKAAYFFVTPYGRAYAVDPDDQFRYVELGNVLEDASIPRRWGAVGDRDKNVARFQRRVIT